MSRNPTHLNGGLKRPEPQRQRLMEPGGESGRDMRIAKGETRFRRGADVVRVRARECSSPGQQLKQASTANDTFTPAFA